MITRSFGSYLALSCCLFSLTVAENRYISWVKEHFRQYKPVRAQTYGAKRLVRTVRVYDYFSTVGIFDALLLDQEVMEAVQNLYNQRTGKEEIVKIAPKSLEFYILALDEPNYSLGITADELINWSVYIKVDGKKYIPSNVSVVTLSSEYKALFGERYNRFKRSYKVVFDGIKPDSLTEVSWLELVLSSVKYRAVITWHRSMRCDGTYSDWH